MPKLEILFIFYISELRCLNCQKGIFCGPMAVRGIPLNASQIIASFLLCAE